MKSQGMGVCLQYQGCGDDLANILFLKTNEQAKQKLTNTPASNGILHSNHLIIYNQSIGLWLDYILTLRVDF